MTNINKSNAIAELNTLISGLTVATETSNELVLILKTADLAGADSSSIKTEILSRLAAATNSTTIEELAVLIAGLPIVTANRSIFVTDLTDLSSLVVDPGTIVFVIEENLPYVYRSDDTWVLLFSSLQPPKPLNNLWTWGSNSDGQLGDNTTVNKSSPVSAVGGYTDWIQVEANFLNTLALRANGTAWAWGDNSFGQLGDNTAVDKSSPVSVVGGFTDWIQVSTGLGHSLGVRADGTAWAWGLNTSGRLGDNTTVDKSSPVSIVGGFTDWVQVSAGGTTSLGVRANGTAWGWGDNANGRIGDSTTNSTSSPVSVVGGYTDWVQVSSGRNHSLGLRANGTAWSWGGGGSGQLGDGTAVDNSSPVSVVGGFTDWVQLSSGSEFSLGLRAGGTAWAWGLNTSGQLGDNTTVDKSSPVSVVGGFTNWVQVDAGYTHAVALRSNGTAWAWGGNTGVPLGDNTTVDKSSPVSVVGGFTDWIQVSAGNGVIAGTNLHSAGIRGG